MKKFLKNWFTDNRKAGLMRWWLVGMCYFMIGFGTQVGGYSSPIDFIFFLGVGIGLVTIVVYNPIAYNVFRLTRNGEILNHTYRNISGASRQHDYSNFGLPDLSEPEFAAQSDAGTPG